MEMSDGVGNMRGCEGVGRAERGYYAVDRGRDYEVVGQASGRDCEAGGGAGVWLAPIIRV